MATLLEVEDVFVLPRRLSLRTGDWLSFAATGARVKGRGDDPGIDAVIVIRGFLVRGVIGTDGQVLTPEGPPNVILCQAARSGNGEIEVFTGDPFRGQVRTVLEIEVRD